MTLALLGTFLFDCQGVQYIYPLNIRVRSPSSLLELFYSGSSFAIGLP